MVFSSLVFLFRFLPAVLILYYIVPRKFKNFILLITSLFFYAWGEPVYVCLLVISTVLDYTVGRMIGHYRKKERRHAMTLCLLLSLTVNIGLLFVFKYSDFIIQSINNVIHTDIPLPELALPIGISFYTFQTLSYTIDVYRDKVSPQRNIISFGAYVVLFPQLIAGPIVRYKTIADELENRRETFADFSEGAARFSVGLAKKVVIANSVGELFNEIAGMSSGDLTFVTAWLGVIAFTFQIYFDFSGYSDMAIGLGRMFGFHFPENFDHPYESRSVTEFWRRWHISLGSWFKEYVYIPLGGNRKGIGRQICNITIVWFLTGLWHGASWNFVLWGLYYGLLLVIEKLFLLRLFDRLPSFIGHIYTLLAVVVGWAFFCYPDVTDRAGFVGALLLQAQGGLSDNRSLYLLTTNALLLMIAAICSTSTIKRHVSLLSIFSRDKAGSFGDQEGTSNKSDGQTLVVGIVRSIIITVCLFISIVYLISDSFNPFLYFRF